MRRKLVVMALVIGLTACSGTNGSSNQPSGIVGNPQAINGRELQIVTGQTLYVPAYAEIFYGSTEQTMELAVTLSIHNTDLALPIIIQSVRYYNTDGELITEYVEEPIEVSALATIGFVVPDSDIRGGWGANFIVEWGAEQPVHEPVVEALMVSTRGTQGISMISEGRILSQKTAAGE